MSLWLLLIIVGVIFAGAVQDMVVLFFSMRRDGKSLGQMVREEIGVVGGIAALVAVFAIMIIILAVLALVVVNAMAESPWAVFSIALTIPIALFMGFYLRHLRPGRVAEVTVIGVALLLLAICGGGYVEQLNGQPNRWETIKKWELLDHDLTIESGELTPSLKVKRAVVEANNKDLIDSFYS